MYSDRSKYPNSPVCLLRKELNMSLNEFAAYVFLAVGTIQNYERKGCPVPRKIKNAIALQQALAKGEQQG